MAVVCQRQRFRTLRLNARAARLSLSFLASGAFSSSRAVLVLFSACSAVHRPGGKHVTPGGARVCLRLARTAAVAGGAVGWRQSGSPRSERLPVVVSVLTSA